VTILFKTKSIFGRDVIFTSEALHHIVTRHPEMVGLETEIMKTITEPDFIVKGQHLEDIALKHYPDSPLGDKYLVVAYIEDGEVLTSFLTSKLEKILRRGVKWKRS
jgi:hypothetical protein